jgi:hypothetical protein
MKLMQSRRKKEEDSSLRLRRQGKRAPPRLLTPSLYRPPLLYQNFLRINAFREKDEVKMLNAVTLNKFFTSISNTSSNKDREE